MAMFMRKSMGNNAGGRPSIFGPVRASIASSESLAVVHRSATAGSWSNPSFLRTFTSQDMGPNMGGDQQGKESNPQPKALFPDANAMKDDLRKQMAKPEYDVAKFYYKNGIWQWLARHPSFEKLTLTVIALNAVWIAVDTDFNSSSVLTQAEPIFQIAEHLFCIYFSFEWTMRFMAFKRKTDGRKDFWFIFDSMLVLMMVLETWVMTSIMFLLDFPFGDGFGNTSILRTARLLRLTRMARMARLLRAMPELLILIKGMAAAMRSVCFTLGLLTVIVYVFAIAFTQLCHETDCAREFKSVGHSMHYLLVKGALMDGIGDVKKLLEPQSYILLSIFYFFVLLAALTVMNMLIGVICEVVSAVATTEQERMTVSFVKDKIAALIHDHDKNNDDTISRSEFKDMFSNTKAMAILQDVGVDVIGLVDFADTIFDDACEAIGEEKLSFEEFMGLILDLRGSNTATVKDVVDLRKHINSRIENFESRLLELPHFAMFRQNTKCRHLCRANSIQSGQSMSSRGTQDPVKVLRQLVDQALHDFTALHHREMNDLKEQTRRLKEALVSHGGDVMAATGSLSTHDRSTNFEDDFRVHGNNEKPLFQDIPKTNKLKDVPMEERVAELSSKLPLEEAFVEMTYHKGCQVLETCLPQLGNLDKLHNDTHHRADGKLQDSHMAVTDGTECRESSASTSATSSNRPQQDRSPKRGDLLAKHTL